MIRPSWACGLSGCTWTLPTFLDHGHQLVWPRFHPPGPSYASILPQTYVLAASTVLSYTLVIVLIITPRTFFVVGAGRSTNFVGGRGLIASATGSIPMLRLGRRPYLQKVAALTVAISLTIASARTFEEAKKLQYDGTWDATTLRANVVGGLDIRIFRFISDTFLWLAQAQTLIRLFPRHKERLIIKWTAVALIVLDTIFSLLDNFVYSGDSQVRSSAHAVPALRYLFQLALSVLYAVTVMYYSFSKREFAFYHPRMPNICLVAALALTAVVVPILFFVVDILKPTIADWGEYVRWVGALAASVMVWEWVEQIEAIEREKLQEGILGREVFDGDETFDFAPSMRLGWPRERQRSSGTDTLPSEGGRITEGSSAWRSRIRHYLSIKGHSPLQIHRSQRQSILPVTVIPAPARYTCTRSSIQRQEVVEGASSVEMTDVLQPSILPPTED